MLPSYLIAAFAKRVARLALYAPAPTIQWVVPFIYNLLKKHPACRVMIHREGGDVQAKDPYVEEDPNPSTCRAIDSSLWELQTLTRHHWGTVARQAGIFSDRFTKPPFDLGKILDGETAPFSYEEIVEAELGHMWSRRPPTNLDIPTEAFD
jgi:U3 small nucleolar RNA-associated protein 19